MNPARWPLHLGRRARAYVPDRAVEAAQAFLATEAAGGIVLLAATVIALIWINSPWDDSYTDLWATHITIDLHVVDFSEDLHALVNDGFMTLFFFVVGLEIKRELVRGELADWRRAILPATAAIGGMVVPAMIYIAFNSSGQAARGWGVPMATDIAFAVGVLSLLSGRIPFGAKIFLLALAIVDDVGAILVIAVFYTSDISLTALAAAGILLALVTVARESNIQQRNVYVALGVMLWFALFESGVHATIAGVALGLLTPSQPAREPAQFAASVGPYLDHWDTALSLGDKGEQEAVLSEIEDLTRDSEAPLERLERELHTWVSFGIMPLFALANAGIVLSGDTIREAVSSPVTQGIAIGLLLGKPVGIFAFSFILVRLGICALPRGVSWKHIAGVGIVAGIGFTVSLFITGLAYETDLLHSEAKLGIFAGSFVSAVVGLVLLRFVTEKPETPS